MLRKFLKIQGKYKRKLCKKGENLSKPTLRGKLVIFTVRENDQEKKRKKEGQREEKMGFLGFLERESGNPIQIVVWTRNFAKVSSQKNVQCI